MILGAHVSAAGGVQNSPGNGLELGCQSIQIFTRNQRQWKAKPLTDSEVEGFRQELKRSGIRSTAAHASYLLNLGSPEPAVLARSREAFSQELERCRRLGLDYLVVHPGAHLGSGESAGLRAVADSLNRTLERNPAACTRILLETTAGQGSHLGVPLRAPGRNPLPGGGIRAGGGLRGHLPHFCGRLRYSGRSRLPSDTRTTRPGPRPLSRVKAFHLNDSKRELGSRVDRHEHIGEGCIGAEGFRLLVKDRRFARTPMILETPGGETHYEKNLNRLRQLHG